MMQRRSFISSAAALGALGLAPRAFAQAYPSQQVKFIVPYSPGGLPDTVARIVAQDSLNALASQSSSTTARAPTASLRRPPSPRPCPTAIPCC